MAEDTEFKPFHEKALDRWRQAKDFSSVWRRDAKDDFAFVCGNQWLEGDKQILEQQGRPPITFNYSEKMLDAVVGAEISNRQEVRFFPREQTDSALSELWTAAAKWVRDQCNAEDEETDAFRDALVCGHGFTETKMDYESDPDGKIVIERIDPIEMYWDPAASRSGLQDSRFFIRAVWVDKLEVERLWPGKVLGLTDMTASPGGGVVRQNRGYEDEEADEEERRRDQVQLLHYQWYEKEPFYRVASAQGIVELSSEEFGKSRAEIEKQNLSHVKSIKRVYYRAYLGGETLLEKTKLPCQCGFTFKAITGKRDRNKNVWYGLTRVMKDPQRWANKWLSQILHIINTNAKGGLLAEIGAFVDPKKAQDEWSSPDSITLLSEGGISKLKEKTMAPYPAGLDRLMDFALNSLPMVTGINLEALGLANREQAGVLEAQRKQAAYGLLAPFFNALRLYRKTQGEVLLYFIKEFISDGRLIRIFGPDGEKYVPLAKAPDAVRYDIIVDQAPDSPDSKQKTWESLVQLMPAMLKAGVPIPPDVFDFTPLPTALAQKWKQFVQQRNVSPEQAQQLQQKMAQLTQENQKLKLDQSMELAQLQLKKAEAEAELQIKVKGQQQDMMLEKARVESDILLARAKLEADIALKARQCETDIETRRNQVDGDLKIKALVAGIGSMPDGGGLSLKLDTGELAKTHKDLVDGQQAILASVQSGNRAVQEAVGGLVKAMNTPRKRIPVRGRDGRVIRVDETLVS